MWIQTSPPWILDGDVRTALGDVERLSGRHVVPGASHGDLDDHPLEGGDVAQGHVHADHVVRCDLRGNGLVHVLHDPIHHGGGLGGEVGDGERDDACSDVPGDLNGRVRHPALRRDRCSCDSGDNNRRRGSNQEALRTMDSGTG